MECCICNARGKYTKADPTVEGIPQCRRCALEAKWETRTQPLPPPDLMMFQALIGSPR
jgi:hypothetical protein